MKKKPSLAESLGKAKNTLVFSSAQTSVTEQAPTHFIEPSNKQIQPPSRVGKKPITGFFEPEVSRQLKLLALNNDVTVQALITEAINDLFIKHGKSAIAR